MTHQKFSNIIKVMLTILFISFVLLPFVYILFLSIFSYFKYPELIPSGFTAKYWKGILFQNTLFYSSVLNTMVIGVIVAFVATVIGQLTGRAFVRYIGDVKWATMLVSVPLFIPAMPLFLGVHQVLLGTSIVNNLLGVCVGHILICIPYTSNIAISYYKGIPVEMEQVVKTLGGSWKTVLIKVLLPMMAPGLGLSLSISFLISTTEYFSVFLIGGGNVITLSMLMYPFINNSEYGFASVTGLIFIGVNLIVFISLDKIVKKYSQQSVLFEIG